MLFRRTIVVKIVIQKEDLRRFPRYPVIIVVNRVEMNSRYPNVKLSLS